MGKGNAIKSAMSRARNEDNAPKAGGGGAQGKAARVSGQVKQVRVARFVFEGGAEGGQRAGSLVRRAQQPATSGRAERGAATGAGRGCGRGLRLRATQPAARRAAWRRTQGDAALRHARSSAWLCALRLPRGAQLIFFQMRLR